MACWTAFLSLVADVVLPFAAATIVAVSCGILAVLFLVQRNGTAKISYAFSPIMLAFLGLNAGVGAYNIGKHNPAIFKVAVSCPCRRKLCTVCSSICVCTQHPVILSVLRGVCCRRCHRTTGFGSSCATAQRGGGPSAACCCLPPAQKPCLQTWVRRFCFGVGHACLDLQVAVCVWALAPMLHN